MFLLVSSVSCFVINMCVIITKIVLLLCVFIISFIGSAELVSEHIYRSTDGTLYIFHPECRIYLDAKRECEDEEGHLAILNSDREAALLASILHGYEDILNCESELYLGVHYDSALNGFLTLDGHTLEEAGYSRWAEGEPNNLTTYSMAGEQCVSMFRNKELNDLVCGHFRPFVCEISGYLHNSGSRYKTHRTAKKPSEAARICQAHGGHLAIVNDPNEARIVEQAVPAVYASARMFGIRNPYVVVGRHYMESIPQLSDPESLNNVTHIHQNIKNNRCIGVDASGRLVSVDCAKKYIFICEITELVYDEIIHIQVEDTA